jgi:hypothetical protein
MKKITIAISVLLLLLALPALSHFGQSPSTAKPVLNIALSTSPVDFIGSVDVSGLPNSPGPASTANSLLSLLPTLPSSPKPAPLAPAFQTKDVSPGSSYINVANSIEGTPGYNPNPCLCAPSDMGLAASNQYVVQMVNLAGTVYSTSGTIVKPTFSLSDFWFAPVRSMSDPQILYDARAGRWFASIIVFVDHVRIAVSANSNPTGIWYIYQVHTPTLNCATSPPTNPNPNCLPDQPWIGYSDDKLLIGANDFVFDSTTGIGAPFVGAQYWILNKLEMMAGAFTIDAYTNTPSPTDISVRPVPTLSPTTTAYMAENCLTVTPGVLFNNCPPSASQGGIIVFTVTGTPPGPVTVTPTTVPITITGFPANADQPGHPGTLVTNDNRIVSTVWNHNLLWTALNDGNSTNGGQCGTIPSCIRLDEISTSGTPSLLQDFDFTANGGAATYYGAVSTDTSNNLVVMYETSSSTAYPSLYVTGQLATATPDTLAPSRLVQAGSASDLTTRWGDYFYAATQPGSPSTFWISGDYRTIELFQGWQTRIAKITFTTNNPPPPPPCTESDGNGEFQGQQHGNFAFDNDGCKDGDQNEVSSSDRGDGKDFRSTQLNTVQYDAVAHMITITGVGVSAGRTVTFVFTALETGPTTPGWVSFSFSDGYSSAGILLNGSIVLQ